MACAGADMHGFSHLLDVCDLHKLGKSSFEIYTLQTVAVSLGQKDLAMQSYDWLVGAASQLYAHLHPATHKRLGGISRCRRHIKA